MTFSTIPLSQRSFQDCLGAWVLTSENPWSPRILGQVVAYASQRYDGCRLLEIAYRDPQMPHLNGLRYNYPQDKLVVVNPLQPGFREAVLHAELEGALSSGDALAAPVPCKLRL